MSQNVPALSPEEIQNYFPIRTLSTKTGVNSVTLRAWERRYGLLKPQRTEKGHRLYSESDVVRVEAIVRWIQQGVAVSKVRALLDQEEGAETIPAEILAPETEWLEWQTKLVSWSKSFDEDKIEHLFKQVFSQYPALIAVQNWILPSLKQLGSNVHSRFCEAVLTRQFISRMASLKNQQTASSTIVITGLTGQRSFWCYMASAVLNDQGVACRIVPNMSSEEDWYALIEGIEANAVIAFCENETNLKAVETIKTLAMANKPIALIGASFWLTANESKMTNFEQVNVYSEALEGITATFKVLSV